MPPMFNIMDNMKDDGSVKRGSKLTCGNMNSGLVITQLD